MNSDVNGTEARSDRLPAPNLFGFDQLFDERTIETTTLIDKGFPRDTSIMITGRPGAGKSVFALSLVWETINALAYRTSNHTTAAGLPAHCQYRDCSLIYVGMQLDPDRVKRRFVRNGWPVHAAAFHIISINETDLPQPVTDSDEIVNAILTRFRKLVISPSYTATTNKNVFVVFDTLTSIVKASKSTGDRQRHITEIMTTTRSLLGNSKALCAMIADTTDDPDDPTAIEKQVAPDYVFHLGYRDLGGGRMRRSVEVRKSSNRAPMMQGVHSWDIVDSNNITAVFADKGIRLERKRYHTAIEQQQCNLAYDADRDGGLRTASPSWTEIAIFARPRFLNVAYLQDSMWRAPKPTVLASPRLYCGVPGLDQMLMSNYEYWARPAQSILNSQNIDTSATQTGDGRSLLPGGLAAGTVTYLLGNAGTGKTICGLQFLLKEPDTSHCLYVNFENRPHRVFEWYPGNEKDKVRLRKVRRLFRPRSNLDINQLISELRWIVLTHNVKRIFFDGISDLIPLFSPLEYSRAVEELLHAIRLASLAQKHHEEPPITILLSIVGDPDDPESKPYGLNDSPADNVILFRQVNVNDERRHTVEVSKARGQSPDKQVREIVVLQNESYPLRVVPGLESYSGLRSSDPRPVRLALQLFEENSAENITNRRLLTRLRRLLGHEIKHFGFSRGEIVRTLLDIASGTDSIPFSDVKLFHIDEWWSQELRVRAVGKSKKRLAQSWHPLLKMNAFLASHAKVVIKQNETLATFIPSDHWALELEKVSCPIITYPDRDEDAISIRKQGEIDTESDRIAERVRLSSDIIAVPAYTDYGIFAYIKPEYDVNVTSEGDSKRSVRDVLDMIPRVWARMDNRGWFKPGTDTDNPETVVDLIRIKLNERRLRHKYLEHKNDGKSLLPPIGFAFDMATTSTVSCFFLELCWAFGATEDVFVRDLGKWKEIASKEDRDTYIASHAATNALTLLMYLVSEELMPVRTTVYDAGRAVLARLWYSSIEDVESDRSLGSSPISYDDEGHGPPHQDRRNPANAVQPNRLVLPLPFFPIGAYFHSCPEGVISLPLNIFLRDILDRFNRWLDRLKSVAIYRRDIPADVETQDSFLANLIKCRQIVDDPWAGRDVFAVHLSADRANTFLDAMESAGEALDGYVNESSVFSFSGGLERPFFDLNALDNEANEAEHISVSATQMSSDLPYAMFMDTRDFKRLLSWHRFRIAMARADLSRDGTTLSTLVFPRTHTNDSEVEGGNENTDRARDRVSAGRDAGKRMGHSAVAISGFCCEGTWAVGADRTTRSPNLAANVLMELASYDSAVERAMLGGGIPTRKDFFEHFGAHAVPHVPKIPEYDWEHFVLFLGSRSRRRSRAFCSRVELSSAFKKIEELLFSALDFADRQRAKYRDQNGGNDQSIRDMVTHARTSISRLFGWLTAHTQQQSSLDRQGTSTSNKTDTGVGEGGMAGEDVGVPVCVTCASAETCRVILKS